MRTIYIDSEFKCHVFDNRDMIAIKTDFFDDKCDAFIEGYRFIPANEIWTRDDGVVFNGEMIVPWKPYSELGIIQRNYEQKLLKEYEAEIAELDFTILEMQYQSLVEGL